MALASILDRPSNLIRLLAVASALLAAVSYVFQILRQYYRLRHFKGPAGVGFSKWWMIKKQIAGSMNTVMGEVSETYGTRKPLDIIPQFYFPPRPS